MSIVTTDDSNYTAIAQAIRDKTGSETQYKPAEMAAGVAEVFAAGEQSEYDRFWDAYQQSGGRTDYQAAFYGAGWTDDMFCPKYDLLPSGSDAVYFMFRKSKLTDVAGLLNELGLTLSTAQCTGSAQEMFGNCKSLTAVPELDLQNCTSLTHLFAYCGKLEWVEKLMIGASTVFRSSFVGCGSLEHIVLDGELGANGLDLSPVSRLDKESITSVVTVLSDSTSGLTVTLSLTAVNAAFETSEGAADGSESEEWAALAATKSNWTISLV